MGSREKEQATPHQLSSLVVRRTYSSGGTNSDSLSSASTDYEPGEVRANEPPPYSRFVSNHGHKMRPRSSSPSSPSLSSSPSPSPIRRRIKEDNRYSPDFDHSSGGPPPRGGGRGRGRGRYRDYSPPPPPYGRGRGGGRFTGRGFDGPRPIRGRGAIIRPREGDWFCPDHLCNNLNFARREICNKCKRYRYVPNGFRGRMMNGYRSPTPPPPPPYRGFARYDGPRDFRGDGPTYMRYEDEGRFYDPRERQDYRENEYWGHREDNLFMYERRQFTPPPLGLSQGGYYDREVRERSRSPIRGPIRGRGIRGRGGYYRREMYVERGGYY